jgi:hypothetical protein
VSDSVNRSERHPMVWNDVQSGSDAPSAVQQLTASLGNLCRVGTAEAVAEVCWEFVLHHQGYLFKYRIRNGRIILWKAYKSWVHTRDATIGDSLAQGDSFVWFFSQVVFLFAPDTGHLSRTIMPMDIGSFKCLFSCCWVTPLWPIASKFPILQERRCSFAVARSYCKDEPFVSFCPVQICPPVLFQEDDVFHCQ